MVWRARLVVALVGLVVAVPALAGCGSSQPSAAGGAAASGDSFPLTVSGTLPGQEKPVVATIPAKPKRIVLVDSGNLLDALLALHAPVVAAAQSNGSWFPSQTGPVPASVTPLHLGATPNFEQIAALHPDVIIGLPGQLRTSYAKYAKIAPTAVINFASYKPGAKPEWEFYLEQVARVAGESAQVPGIEAHMRAAAEPLRAKLRGWKGVVVEAYPSIPKFLICYGQAGELLSSLGADIDDSTRAENCSQISPEDFAAKLTAPNILVTQANPGNSDLASFQQQPLWSSLPAVKAGHVFTMPIWWAESGPSAYFKTLDTITTVITDLPTS